MLSLRLTGMMAFAAAFAVAASPAYSTDCTPVGGTLGVSRTIMLKPGQFPLLGKMQYRETLRLRDREIVLSFGDGPSAPYTSTILDALAAECVKATFFMTGNAIVDAPDLLRRAVNEGHTIGMQTFSGENMREMSFEAAKQDIDKGAMTAHEALGRDDGVAPFFRAHFLAIPRQAERYLLSKRMSIWSGDVGPNDWDEPTEEELVATTVKSLERVRRGILMLHDNQPVVARAIKPLLAELKARKFKIVHVLPFKAPTTTGQAQ